MNPHIETQSVITPENLEPNVVGHARRCAVERIRFVSTEISTKQLSANRSNALKSTGPKPPEGLAVSQMSALKHGIFSKEVFGETASPIVAKLQPAGPSHSAGGEYEAGAQSH